MTTSNNFNLAELSKKAFGITGVRFAIPDAPVNSSYVQGGFDASAIDIIPFPTTSVMSVLGTPIFEQITLTIPAIVKSGIVVTPQKTYTFPGWPLFDITYQKNIVKTPSAGRDGTVKEYISDDDYAITIRGFLINDDEYDYPEQQMADLIPAMKSKTSLGITSQVHNMLDIHNIVIERCRFTAVEGYPNIQPFVMDCSSDEPVELEIKAVKNRKPIIAGL